LASRAFFCHDGGRIPFVHVHPDAVRDRRHRGGHRLRRCERTREALSRLAAARACRYRSVVVIREWPWRSSPRRGRRRRRRAAIRSVAEIVETERAQAGGVAGALDGLTRGLAMSRAGPALFAAAATEYPAHIPGGRRKLPPTPSSPRNATAETPCSGPYSPPIPSQPESAMTGLPRRRSRARVP